MRKLLLSAFGFALSTTLFAQNLDNVQELISKNKYGEAREKIDKILTEPKGQKTANAWYYKAVVYNALSKDSTTDNTGLRKDAFDAYVKYQELDQKNLMGTLEQNVILFDLHSQNLQSAYNKHNKQSYADAVKFYNNAFQVQQYINKKGFEYNSQKLPAFDTTNVYYAGTAALLAKDTASGVKLFEEFANYKIGGKDYIFAYQTLVDYYNKRGDEANAEKYAGMGKQLYPDNGYWSYYALQDPKFQDNPTALFAKYEQMIAKDPKNKDLVQDYAMELYSYTYKDDKRSRDSSLQKKTGDALRRSIELSPNAMNNFIMYSSIQNESYYMYDAMTKIKGTKPEDLKRKKNMEAAIDRKDAEAIKYAVAAEEYFSKMDKLKGSEKANYQELLRNLSKYYKQKNQADKAAAYDAKLKSL